MYAQLGQDNPIVFDVLIGPESLSDKRETKYAEHALINGKPILQRIGQELIEISIGITFNVAFCNPEDQYARLESARIAGEILPFIYGNGFYEGDFVISAIERTVNQTDKIGNFVFITCSITLKEYISSNPLANQQERDKQNAFAISSNRPLPANPNTQPVNPALAVTQSNSKVQFSAQDADQLSANVNNSVNSESGVINQGQKFVDSINEYSRKTIDVLNVIIESVDEIDALISLHSSLIMESPGLSSATSAARASAQAAQNQLSVLAGLPSTINNTPDALYVLNELKNTLTIISDLKESSKELNDANASIALMVATKKRA